MNLKFPPVSASDCLTEDVCQCPGAENLDHYCNGSISSSLEIRAIESHLLTCKSCQLKLEELDRFDATLQQAERLLKFTPLTSEASRQSLQAGLNPLASFVGIFALTALFLMIRVREPLPDFKQVTLTSTRSASDDSHLPAKALAFVIDSPASITRSPYSLRLLSSDGFILKSTPQKHLQVLSLPKGLPQGRYWIQLVVSESIEPLREYGVYVKGESLQPPISSFIHKYFF